MEYYAHKADDGRLQTIKEHALAVAAAAEAEASRWGTAELGRLAGLYHDCGKYSQPFQRRLEGSTVRYEHASAGVYLMMEQGIRTKNFAALLLAHIIGGHHSGLPDTGSPSCESERTLYQCKQGKQRKHRKHRK